MGVGFAIPVRQVSAALGEFFAPETMNGLWFGAGVGGFQWPLSITSVQPGSPADKAGLHVGQKILQVGNETPRGLVDFNRLLTSAKNNTATLVVQQDRRQDKVTVKLLPFDDLIRQKLGMDLLNLTPQISERFQANVGEGVFIEKVERNGPADRAQLQSGFLLTAIDDQRTGDLNQVAKVLSQKESGDRVRLTVVVPRRLGNSYVEFRQGTAEVTVR
jgi:S1-C subfamily serine protease